VFLATSRNAWAQVPEYYDGVVSEPTISVWFDTSTSQTNVVAVGESWTDAESGNVRLEASFSYFKLVADDAPVAVTFSRGEAYSSQGVKLGIEETLLGQLTPADVKRLSKAKQAQIKVGKEFYDLSQQTQTKLAELIDLPHSAPAAP
jgi:hypothetical protein